MDGTIVNCLSGDALTLEGGDRVVIGPRQEGESSNQRWILTTSGLVVAKDDVGARLTVGVDGVRAEVKLRRSQGKEEEDKSGKDGFHFHVILDPDEVTWGGRGEFGGGERLNGN